MPDLYWSEEAALENRTKVPIQRQNKWVEPGFSNRGTKRTLIVGLLHGGLPLHEVDKNGVLGVSAALPGLEHMASLGGEEHDSGIVFDLVSPKELWVAPGPRVFADADSDALVRSLPEAEVEIAKNDRVGVENRVSSKGDRSSIRAFS